MMSAIKIVIFIVIALPILAGGGLFFLVQQSKESAPPGLVDGVLAACPSSPNCVRSESGTPATHAVPPLPLASWERLATVIEQTGGVVTAQGDNYLSAEYSSKLFGFVDDVEFRKATDAIHVRSGSRVGHSDMGANRKRLADFRKAVE
jgi:uncharacterized protein (DUF1499 family)